MPNWIGALEAGAKIAEDEIARAGPGKGEDLLSLVGHGADLSGRLDSLATSNLAGLAGKNVVADMPALAGVHGDESLTSHILPSLVVEDAAREQASARLANPASLELNNLLPWEHPLRASARGYDPWLEGI